MAQVTLSPTITFNGKEAQTGIVERAYKKQSFTRIHTIHENLKAKEQIAYLRRFSKVSILDAGCGSGTLAKLIPAHEKFWEPKNIKVWLKFCWKDFEAQFWAWTIKNGIDRQDLDDTYLGDFVMDVVPDAMLDDLWRMVWFGDEAAAHHAASPAGENYRSTDVQYYSMLDGFWKQIFAGVAISDPETWGHIPRYTIAKNAEASYSAQLNLAEGDWKTVARQLLYQSDDRLRDAGDDLVYLFSRTLFDNYREYKESKVLESSFAKEDKMFFDGRYWEIPIIAVPEWDRVIRSDFHDGTAYHLPHRAILTTLDNLAVGFDAMGEASSLKTYLDDETELWNVKGGYKLDAKIIENYMFSVAY